MPDIKKLLSGKTAGIPNAILAVAGGVGIWWFFLRKQSQSSSSSTASGVSPDSAYGLGYAQGLQAAAGNVPGSPAPPTPAVPKPPKSNGDKDTGRHPILPNVQPVSRPPSPSPAPCFPGGPTGYLCGGPPLNGKPCPPGDYGPGEPYCTAGNPPVGGGRSVGSRSARTMTHFHPAITQRVKYAHYVRAIGGPQLHAAEIQRVATQSGVHPARLRALNPVYTGKIRVA